MQRSFTMDRCLPPTVYHQNREQAIVDVLRTMDPDTCAQSDMIALYREETRHYQQQNRFMSICDDAQTSLDSRIQTKIIGLLEAILNDGALALDVAFCRLIVLYGYTNSCNSSWLQYMVFLLYFVLGSCLPSIRRNIKINDPNHPGYHCLYGRSKIIRYLVDIYFSNLNDKTCIKFKYNGSTRTIQTLLEHHITTATEHGDASIAHIICDYAHYPNEEFLYFINNFMCHFSLYSWTLIRSLVKWFDIKGDDEPDFVSRLLRCDAFSDHRDPQLKYEAHKMALIKLRTSTRTSFDISSYFAHPRNKRIRCSVSPRQFVQLIEFAVPNPWQCVKEAMLGDACPLSIFFNGNKREEEGMTSVVYNDSWCGELVLNIHLIFNEIIDPYFDKTNREWMANVLYQLANCTLFVLKASIETYAARNEVIEVLLQYINRETKSYNWFAVISENSKYAQTFHAFECQLVVDLMCFDLSFMWSHDSIERITKHNMYCLYLILVAAV
eukprot:224622_1